MRNFVFPKNYTLASMALLAILFFIIIGGTVYHQILEQKLSKIMVEKSVCDKALQSLFLSHLYLEERLNNELPHTSIAYMKHLNNFKNNVEKLKKTEHHLFPHNFNELVNNFISITHKRTQNNTKSVELEYHRAFLKLEGAINGHNIALSDIFAKSMQYEYKVALAGLILTLIVLLIVFTILFRVIFVSGQAEGEVFRLKSIIENTPDFVAMADVNGNTLYVNPAGRAMMGFGSEEDLSKYKIADYHSRTMAENIHRICIPAAIQKGVWKGDTKFKSSSGEEISTSQVLIAHKDKMGKPIYFSTIARNVEKEKADTQEIVHHEQLEKLVADVSKNFAMTDLFSVDAYIQNSLSSLGRFSHADRAIIFWLSDDGKVLNNTDEWCAPGVSSEKSKLQNIDFSQYPWFGQHMLQNKPVIVNDVANLSEEAAHEKAEWQQEHIKSLLAVPLAHNNEFTGFLGVVNVIKEREWQDDDVDLLSTLGSVLLQAKMMQSSPDMNEFQISKKTKLLTQTIAAIASTIEKRDPYTAGHQLRVAELSVKIAKKLGLEASRIDGLELAAMIHDIGKIQIPAEILNRPGKLTETEFELIKSHPQVGYDILAVIDSPWQIAKIVLQHHERLDGSGYPFGLKDDEILLESKIIAVADVMESMSSHRPYRASHSISEAIDELISGKNKLYDAGAVDACVDIFRGGFTFSKPPF